MSTFILVLVVLAVLHFVIEGILAPSLRLQLRNKLFQLRDEVRFLKIEGISKADEEAYFYLHDGINHLLERLNSLTLHNRIMAKRAYENDDALRTRVEARRAMLNKCENEKIQAIFKRTTMLVEEAFLVNAGGWFIYLIPIVLMLLTIDSLKTLASSIVLSSERDANRLIPQT